MIKTDTFWQHKDGGIYMITDIQYNKEYCTNLVWYVGESRVFYVRTESHFLQSFEELE
jgi:hypothetical protein